MRIETGKSFALKWRKYVCREWKTFSEGKDNKT